MQVEWEGDTYTFDLDEIEVEQACTIQDNWNLTLMGLDRGLNDGDPKALTAIYWLMHVQSGKALSVRGINFKVVKFLAAIQEAGERQEREEAEKAKAEKKAKAAARSRPTTQT
jgi:hypothetical protein